MSLLDISKPETDLLTALFEAYLLCLIAKMFFYRYTV